MFEECVICFLFLFLWKFKLETLHFLQCTMEEIKEKIDHIDSYLLKGDVSFKEFEALDDMVIIT